MDAGADLSRNAGDSLVGLFSENLAAVDGHCVIVNGELEIVDALNSIIGQVQKTKLRARRIALSDDAVVERLARLIAAEVEEIAVTPDAAALFGYDVGITRVQAAIAETGTLVLDSASERHRLVSLLPPVHIAIVDASQICLTLGEALSALRRDTEEVSPTITFVTGPSRTADIELTLAIGVHGPQELYVIVNEGSPLANTHGP
jgi:L-lactate dehydrogenase complex protein LldG